MAIIGINQEWPRKVFTYQQGFQGLDVYVMFTVKNKQIVYLCKIPIKITTTDPALYATFVDYLQNYPDSPLAYEIPRRPFYRGLLIKIVYF